MLEPAPTRRTFLKTAGGAVVAGVAAASRVLGRGSGAGHSEQDTTPGPSEEATARGSLLNGLEAIFRPTAAGCTVHWVPGGDVEARVLAGSASDQLAPVRQLTSSDPTEVVIGGFGADSDFYLQCRFRRPGNSSWIARPVRRLHTARPPGSTFRVALVADSHVDNVLDRVVERPLDRENLHRTIAKILDDRPDFVLFLGDEGCIKRGRDALGYMNQDRALARWEQWRREMAQLLAAVPSFLVLGNHEGEAGYYQALKSRPGTLNLQRLATIARKRYYLNPLPDTYPEGGESEGWMGDGADAGNCSPLQNYFAWTWGDALFVVLDAFRYANVGLRPPRRVEQRTLGPTQLRWLEQVLTASQARWKFVLAHNLIGGAAWSGSGQGRGAYGRGGARYARVGEQARITDIMNRTDARFFLYGHDHLFAHQQAEGAHFVCTGRPTGGQAGWWGSPGWKEAYGDPAGGRPHEVYAAIGYTRVTISPERVQFEEFLRTPTDGPTAENMSQQEDEVIHAFSVT